MKPDQERVRNLLTDTVTLLCKNGLHYNKELKVQGLLGITLDENEVFVVHINEKFGDLVASSGILVPDEDADTSQLNINTALMRVRGSKSNRSHSDELADGEPPRKRPEPLRSRRRPSREGASSPRPGSPGSSRSDSQLSASVSSPVIKTEAGVPGDFDPAELPDIKVKQERDIDDDEVIIVGGQDETDIPGSGDDRNAMQETYSNTLSDLQSGVAQLEQIASELDPSLAGSGLDTGVSSAKRKAMPGGSADQLGNLGPFITGMVRHQNSDSATATSSASDISQWDNSVLAGMGQMAGDSQPGAEATPGCSTWDPSQLAARQGGPGGDDSAKLTCRYPSNCLNCQTIKDSLVQNLVQPFALTKRVTPVRLAWRMDGPALEGAWNEIVMRRLMCDDMVRNLPNIDFFISSITGVFTKASSKGMGPKYIYPGISYWIAHEEGVKHPTPSEMEIMRGLKNVCSDAEIKSIRWHYSEKKKEARSVDAISAPLFVVLKDHSNSYIRHKILQSMDKLGMPTIITQTAAKLIVVNPDSLWQLQGACQRLASSGLVIDLEISTPANEQKPAFLPAAI